MAIISTGKLRRGQRCPRDDCHGLLLVRRSKRTARYYIATLRCDRCGLQPETKWVVPIEFAPRRESRRTT